MWLLPRCCFTSFCSRFHRGDSHVMSERISPLLLVWDPAFVLILALLAVLMSLHSEDQLLPNGWGAGS